MSNLEKFRVTRKESAQDTRQRIKEYYQPETTDRKQQHKELSTMTDFVEKNNDLIDDIYDWYATAMQRKDRLPLDKERFITHFFKEQSFDPVFLFGDREKGYLLGYEKYGVFVPTHFAPRNIRRGYDLIKQLGESKNTPAVMAITTDLVATITKLPAWKEFDMSFLASFGGDVLVKKVVYNQHPGVQQLMLGLLQDYINESNSYEQAHDNKNNYEEQ